MALGTGGIKPNVSAFGAEQFDESNAQDAQEKASFFNWFYFAINVGSLIASLVVVRAPPSQDQGSSSRAICGLAQCGTGIGGTWRVSGGRQDQD